jgi:hypothetical protein
MEGVMKDNLINYRHAHPDEEKMYVPVSLHAHDMQITKIVAGACASASTA